MLVGRRRLRQRALKQFGCRRGSAILQRRPRRLTQALDNPDITGSRQAN
jgi:hypothetical protein